MGFVFSLKMVDLNYVVRMTQCHAIGHLPWFTWPDWSHSLYSSSSFSSPSSRQGLRTRNSTRGRHKASFGWVCAAQLDSLEKMWPVATGKHVWRHYQHTMTPTESGSCFFMVTLTKKSYTHITLTISGLNMGLRTGQSCFFTKDDIDLILTMIYAFHNDMPSLACNDLLDLAVVTCSPLLSHNPPSYTHGENWATEN